jgi:hypothetical protein
MYGGFSMPKENVMWDTENEQNLLGSILIDSSRFSELGTLDPVAFHDLRHQVIWKAYKELDASGEVIDYQVLCKTLEHENKLEAAGGQAYLTALNGAVATGMNAGKYFRNVEDDYKRRVILEDLGKQATRYSNRKIPLPKEESQDLVKAIGEYSTWADLNAGTMSYTWDGWLISGMLNLLVSYSGDGKSYLALRLCGCFIKGMDWPDGKPYTGETGKVLWVECEAAQALNLNRANIFGYPLDSIITPFDDPYRDANLDDSIERKVIEGRANLQEVKFILIDSLSGGSRHKENDTGIKEVCLWAAQMGRKAEKPIMLIHHLGKKKEWDTSEITLERVRGSSAIVQFARTVWALSVPDVTNRETKSLSQIKNNLGSWPPAIGMVANDRGITFCAAPKAPHVETVSERCGDFLYDLLSRGPMKQTEVAKELEGAGISPRAAERVKKTMGIVAVRKLGAWWWSLPTNQDTQGV